MSEENKDRLLQHFSGDKTCVLVCDDADRAIRRTAY